MEYREWRRERNEIIRTVIILLLGLALGVCAARLGACLGGTDGANQSQDSRRD